MPMERQAPGTSRDRQANGIVTSPPMPIPPQMEPQEINRIYKPEVRSQYILQPARITHPSTEALNFRCINEPVDRSQMTLTPEATHNSAEANYRYIYEPVDSSQMPLTPAAPYQVTYQSPESLNSRYKTELCRTFEETGRCRYSDKCQFAHGQDELRFLERHPLYKTQNCIKFHMDGFCSYGPRCLFIHDYGFPNIFSSST